MFVAKENPVQFQEIRDIEDSLPGTSSGSPGGVPVVTSRKLPRTEVEESPAKTWQETLGQPPVPGTTKDELLVWLKFHKKKWMWQWEDRSLRKIPKMRSREMKILFRWFLEDTLRRLVGF